MWNHPWDNCLNFLIILSQNFSLYKLFFSKEATSLDRHMPQKGERYMFLIQSSMVLQPEARTWARSTVMFFSVDWNLSQDSCIAQIYFPKYNSSKQDAAKTMFNDGWLVTPKEQKTFHGSLASQLSSNWRIWFSKFIGNWHHLHGSRDGCFQECYKTTKTTRKQKEDTQRNEKNEQRAGRIKCEEESKEQKFKKGGVKTRDEKDLPHPHPSGSGTWHLNTLEDNTHKILYLSINPWQIHGNVNYVKGRSWMLEIDITFWGWKLAKLSYSLRISYW